MKREKKYYYKGKKLTFEQLPIERRVAVIQNIWEEKNLRRADPEVAAANRDYRNSQARKKRRRIKAVTAILKMRGIEGQS